MDTSISHDRSDESLAAKTRWFQSLTEEERMEVFVEMMDMILELNPELLKSKDAQSIPGRVRVLEL